VLLSRELASAGKTDHNTSWIAQQTWMCLHSPLQRLSYAQKTEMHDLEAALSSGKIPCCVEWSCSMGPGSVSCSSLQPIQLILTLFRSKVIDCV
jgi:hypothetical protein